MKALRIAFALTMGILGGVLLAQSDSDFSGWMKQVSKAEAFAITLERKGGSESPNLDALCLMGKL